MGNNYQMFKPFARLLNCLHCGACCQALGIFDLNTPAADKSANLEMLSNTMGLDHGCVVSEIENLQPYAKHVLNERPELDHHTAWALAVEKVEHLRPELKFPLSNAKELIADYQVFNGSTSSCEQQFTKVERISSQQSSMNEDYEEAMVKIISDVSDDVFRDPALYEEARHCWLSIGFGSSRLSGKSNRRDNNLNTQPPEKTRSPIARRPRPIIGT